MEENRDGISEVTEQTDIYQTEPTEHGADAQLPEQEPRKEKRGFACEVFDWVEVMAFSLTFILLVFTYVGRLAVVDGPSMNNTLEHGETLVISKVNYTPKTGDIIVFQNPLGVGVYGQPLIKRVIATEGQWIYIDHENWKTYVYENSEWDTAEEVVANVVPLEDIYGWEINKEPYTSMTGKHEAPRQIPDGKMFVMGDNRNHSADSRSPSVGIVDERYILGKAYFRLTPFERMGAL